jgi:hypothetical protein
VTTLRKHKKHLLWIKAAVVTAVAATIALGGCLGEPEIDERWTLVEVLDVSPQPGYTATAGQPVDVSVNGRITYRRILTGFLVAEVRYSPAVPPSQVALDLTRHTEEVAQDVDLILANSTTAGRAIKAVTGFDHLMQDVHLSFTAQVPDTAAGGGVYVLLYMGAGDEIRLEDGRDSLVVTPFVSSEYEVLHTGFALGVVPPGGRP